MKITLIFLVLAVIAWSYEYQNKQIEERIVYISIDNDNRPPNYDSLPEEDLFFMEAIKNAQPVKE